MPFKIFRRASVLRLHKEKEREKEEEKENPWIQPSVNKPSSPEENKHHESQQILQSANNITPPNEEPEPGGFSAQPPGYKPPRPPMATKHETPAHSFLPTPPPSPSPSPSASTPNQLIPRPLSVGRRPSLKRSIPTPGFHPLSAPQQEQVPMWRCCECGDWTQEKPASERIQHRRVCIRCGHEMCVETSSNPGCHTVLISVKIYPVWATMLLEEAETPNGDTPSPSPSARTSKTRSPNEPGVQMESR